MMTSILFSALLAQQPVISYDDRVIQNPIVAKTQSGKTIEVFEVQSVADDPEAWRPDGTPVAKKDRFPGRSGYKPFATMRIVWARTKTQGLVEPDAVFNSIQGTHAHNMGTAAIKHDGWLYFALICQTTKDEPMPLKSTLDGFLVGGPWKTRSLVRKPADKGQAKPFSDVKSFKWSYGDMMVRDEEAMKRAYGDVLGYAQVGLITKVVQGTTFTLIMGEEWQPHNCRIEILDLNNTPIPQAFTSGGLAMVEGRERGFEVSVQDKSQNIGAVVLSERNGEYFSITGVHLNPGR